MSGHFMYYRTAFDGTPLEDARPIAYQDRRVMMLPWRGDVAKVTRLLEIACENPGTEVDLIDWDDGGVPRHCARVRWVT